MPVVLGVQPLSTQLHQLQRHVTAAKAIIDQMIAASGADSPRDLTHFEKSGVHLSQKGLDAIADLYKQGYKPNEVAKAMGISVGAARRRR